jgi:Putative DNA-binding domain
MEDNIKDWFDPSTPEGKAKIIKTCIAMRNNNGGYLLVGFDNDTGVPNVAGAQANARTIFQSDDVQILVNRHASEPFEVHLHYPEISGREFPVLEVEAGVRAPVATRRPLSDDAGNRLVKENTVYVRSLRANNTPNTTEATWQDWAILVETYFENREADIGRFLRRHLGERGPEVERVFRSAATDPAVSVLARGWERLSSTAERLGVSLPEHGAWEVGVATAPVLSGGLADEPFLNLLMSENPKYTAGWPVWLDSRAFADQNSHPRVYEDGWEMLIPPLSGTALQDRDFWRLEPQGRFYLQRALQDDMRESNRAPEPGTQLDFVLVIRRTAETIATALVFARALGADDDATLRFAFRWGGLEGRRLASWASPGRYLFRDFQALQNEVTTRLSVPVDTPPSAIGPHVQAATAPLFAAFDGATIDDSVVEDLIREMLDI